jgi:indolepyruvate ferredoxin oxidoreductase alpha subunit
MDVPKANPDNSTIGLMMACVGGVPAQVNFFSGVFMAAVMPNPAAQRLLLSGNEAVARGVWEAGTRVAAAYPGTPATEILETLSRYPDLYTEWSVNEKVSLEVAIGASMMGARAFCAMKHVGLNVAATA